MNRLEDPNANSAVTFFLRHDLRPGDLGTLVCLHGTICARECGFDTTFEAHVASLLGQFVQGRTDRDRLWIAEWEGRLVGSLAIVSHSERDAQLCWFLVDPSARSLGLGKRLLHEAVAFCRHWEYEYVFLRNFGVLAPAFRLIRSVGFQKVDERPNKRWGVALVEELYVLHPFGRSHPAAGPSASSR